jgi:glycosyltransferase involved in cell wall biosynthesis
VTPRSPGPLRILHVMTRFQRGGSEGNVLHTIEWEGGAGHEVHLAMGADSQGHGLPADLPVHVVPRLVRSIRPDLDLLAVRELRRLVRTGRYDIVHTHQSKAGILGRMAAAGGRPRLVHTVHMSSFGQGYGALASQLYRIAEQRYARVTHRIVTVGDELMERYVAAGVGVKKQYVVIRSPIELASFLSVRELGTDSVRSLRQTMRLPSTTPVLAAIGALEKRKRFDLLLRELAPNLRDGTVVLAVAGDGPERPALERLSATLGVTDSVRWMGHLDDPSPLLAASDLFVHAGRAEGVSQVVVQALAAGRPVVATESVGLREVEGAQVRIVPWSGEGFGEAVISVLSAPPRPPSPSAFEPWSSAAIDERLAAFHADLGRDWRA